MTSYLVLSFYKCNNANKWDLTCPCVGLDICTIGPLLPSVCSCVSVVKWMRVCYVIMWRIAFAAGPYPDGGFGFCSERAAILHYDST